MKELDAEERKAVDKYFDERNTSEELQDEIDRDNKKEILK